MNRRAFKCAVIMTIAVAAVDAASAATHIAIRERVVLPSSVVRLGDIAEVVSADRTLARSLAALPLMPSPPPGTERYLRAREVKDLLAAHGHNLRDFLFEGAAEVAICTPGGTPRTDRFDVDEAPLPSPPHNRHAAILASQINPTRSVALDAATAVRLREELNHSIARYLNTQSGNAGNWQAACEVDERQLALLDAAIGPIEIQGNRASSAGRQRFIIFLTTPQGAMQMPVYAAVTAAAQPLVVAIRPIARGNVITAADVDLSEIESPPTTSGSRIPFESTDRLIGMEARQAIQVGEIVYSNQVQAPLLVKRGEEVTIVSQGGGIRVRTVARARQDGARGDLVQVESLESRQRFDVRVVGLRECVVYTSIRPASIVPIAKQAETALR